MTSIILVKTEEKLFLIGDTQITYSASTYPQTKIFPLIAGKFLFAGAGSNLLINAIYKNIISIQSLEDFKSRIERGFTKEDLNNGYEIFDSEKLIINDHEKLKRQIDMGVEIFIIDITTLNYKRFIQYTEQYNQDSNFEIIGSGSEFKGLCENKLKEIDKNKDETEIFEKIFECYDLLGKQDAMTGHPALFPIEIFCIKKGELKKWELKYKLETSKSENYGVIKK
jgi:hypothetical protein